MTVMMTTKIKNLMVTPHRLLEGALLMTSIKSKKALNQISKIPITVMFTLENKRKKLKKKFNIYQSNILITNLMKKILIKFLSWNNS